MPRRQWRLTEFAIECLAALTIARVAKLVGHRLMLAVTEVIGKFSIQCFLDQALGQLLEQTVLAYQVFRFL